MSFAFTAECKTSILASAEHSDERRRLVNHIIQLRLQLQQIKEDGGAASSQVDEATCTVAGHTFVEQSMRGRNAYCERCMGIVWRLVQPWYRCDGGCARNVHTPLVLQVAAIVATPNVSTA